MNKKIYIQNDKKQKFFFSFSFFGGDKKTKKGMEGKEM